LRINNVKSALVVSSREHMDEISISDITYGPRLLDNLVAVATLTPVSSINFWCLL
jgi:anthranilate phosphoribosyltransferase